MKTTRKFIVVFFLTYAVVVLAILLTRPGQKKPHFVDYQTIKNQSVAQFSGKVPHQWSETVPGVWTRLATKKNVLALTLDACGSPGDGYDAALIDFLIKEKIPATLFVNSRWIDKNHKVFAKLAANPLFDIQNHGWQHEPLSVTGKSVYGISGTRNVAEVVDEVEKNSRKLQVLTGIRPRYFRSGTAYYDEVSAQIVRALGYEIIGFSVLGDSGARYTKEQVRRAFLSAKPGAIIICHMNHPEGETAQGVMAAVPELKKKGFAFVRLADYPLQ